MKLLLFCTVVSLFLYQTDALINVNLNPLDLDRVGDFFENIMFNNHYQALMQPPSRVIHPLRKKVAYGTIQLLDVMLTIVSSNLLTTKLQPYVGESEAEIIVHVKSLPPVQCECHCHCPQKQQQIQEIKQKQQQFEELLLASYTNNVKDYGCNSNMCWRACFTENHDAKTPWCFSSPTTTERKYHSCMDASECSPFWECLETCHL